MDYSKIRVLMSQRKINETQLAAEIGMSQPGLKSSIEKGTLKVSALESISVALGVPVSFFFEDGDDKKKTCKDCSKLKAQVELLKELMNEKDKEIARLNREMGRKLGTGDSAVA